MSKVSVKFSLIIDGFDFDEINIISPRDSDFFEVALIGQWLPNFCKTLQLSIDVYQKDT